MARKFYIYGLIDPVTHVVRYVGQTKRPPGPRIRQHRFGHVKTTAEWVLSLAEPPQYVLLEVGTNRRLQVSRNGQRPGYTSAAIAAETKWIKRFRRDLVNRRLRNNCAVIWDGLVNREGTCHAQ